MIPFKRVVYTYLVPAVLVAVLLAAGAYLVWFHLAAG